MAIKLKSVFQIAANNIVSSASRSKGSLGTVKKEYNDIVRFLDLQKNEIESIKLPDKKKIAQLANINVASTFGTPGNLLGSLLGGGLDLAGFVGNMFPTKEKAGKSSPVKVKGNKMRFGGIKALGVLNSVFAGLDFYQGVQEGEGVGKAAAGAGASLAGSIVGGVLGSALGPLGTFAGASLGGMAGGWLGDRAYEGVAGNGNKDGVKQKLENKIKAQEAAQKAAVQGENFEDIISRFSSAVSKFEKGVASGLFGTLGQQEQEQENMDDLGETPNTSYTGDPVEPSTESYSAEGGDKPSSNFTSAFGRRWGRQHSGVDFASSSASAPVSIIQPGIIDTGYEAGYGNWVAVKHDNGAETFYGHLSKVMVTKGQRIDAGTVIGNQGNTGRSKGAHVHFEYRPGGPGTNPVDGRGVADSYFRFGGQVKAKKNNTATDTKEKLKPVDTNYPQKKPEEFFKGTSQENIFKDAKLKEEFSGKAKTPEVKAAQTKYNEYVNQIKQQRTQQVSAQMVAPAAPSQVPKIAQYPSYSQSQFYIIDRPSVIAMGGGGGSPQPVNIPSGGGDEGRTAILPGPSEGEVVNSLIKTLLLTNLSAS
jgi:murein DD-endopeptidase MepM/ murein hydrolase activator NlpD